MNENETLSEEDAEARRAFDEAQVEEHFRLEHEIADAEVRTSWAPVNLRPILYGGVQRTEPRFMQRTDGVPLVYAAKTHAFIGESESMKSWAALLVVRERLLDGDITLYLDFEDDAFTYVERLTQMGVEREVIAQRGLYIAPVAALPNPDEVKKLTRAELEHWVHGLLLALQPTGEHPTVVVVDGVTEVMGLHGWDPNAGTDVTAFLDHFPRRFKRDFGCATILIDHVTKAAEGRGRYAIGSVHKLNGIDGAVFAFENVEPLKRGGHGITSIKVSKDRPGWVRQAADSGKLVGELHVISDPNTGAIMAEVRPPEEATGDTGPTVLMERISDFLAKVGAASSSDITGGVTGKTDGVKWALKLLIDDGYVNVETVGRKKMHTLIKPYPDVDLPADVGELFTSLSD